LDILPAPGETWWPVAVVESERKVAGEVLWRNGHMDRDWRRRASIVANFEWEMYAAYEGVGPGGEKEEGEEERREKREVGEEE
jgi:hypothetical protein